MLFLSLCKTLFVGGGGPKNMKGIAGIEILGLYLNYTFINYIVLIHYL